MTRRGFLRRSFASAAFVAGVNFATLVPKRPAFPANQVVNAELFWQKYCSAAQHREVVAAVVRYGWSPQQGPQVPFPMT